MRKNIKTAFIETYGKIVSLAHDRNLLLAVAIAVLCVCSNGAYAQSSEPSVFEMIGGFNWWLQVICYLLAVVFLIKAGYDWNSGHMAQCAMSIGGVIIMILAPHIAKSLFVTSGVLQDGDKVLPTRPSNVK